MGENDGDQSGAETRVSEDLETTPAPPDTLAVPTQKRRRIKSPTPGSLRGRSMTPIRGRSQTPFTLYMTRRSATPSTWRSITPHLKREDKEKTPFELGKDIKTLLYCNKAVFDRALIMDISEPENVQAPVRYITTDMSVIDRAAVMDVSNVEVIYVVEEYEEEEFEEEEIIEEVKPKKKPKGKKGRTPRKSVEKEGSPGSGSVGSGVAAEFDYTEEREESVLSDEGAEPVKKTKKKAAPKKKKEASPTPKLTLSLEIGGGQKASRKMFDQPPAPQARPPPKKSKLVLQMEEQAKAAKLAAEEAAKRESSKPKSETFEERQKRLKAEAEEQARIEEEQRLMEEEQRLLEEEEAAAEAGDGDDDDEDAAGEDEDGDENTEDGSQNDGEDDDVEGGEVYDEEAEEEKDQFVEPPPKPKVKRRGSGESDEFTRPDPNDEEKWKRIAQIEGEEFMQQLRKYSRAVALSEKQRDADWQKRRENARNPTFIAYLTDRTCESGHNVRLTCAVTGPELSVKWFKDGRQLERDVSHRIANNNNILSLEVVNTNILDSGEYSCVVANMNAEVTSSCIVTIYEIFKDEPSPPTFSLIRDFYHLHDDELTIECHIHGIPRPTITWIKSSVEIKPSYKFTILEEAHGVYKLLIYRPSNKDSGKYICRATNSSGQAETSHTIEVAKNKHYHIHGIFHARDRLQRDKESQAKKAMEEALKSKEESDKKRAESIEPKRFRSSPEPMVAPKNKLKFATQLRDRMVMLGQTIKLYCTVIGPDSACRWLKDDKPVQFGPKVRNMSEEGKAVLELADIQPDQSGVYKCVAKNNFSEIDTSCYLKVYTAQVEGDEQEPMFALPLKDVYHSSENDLIIGTKVRGNPRPTILWVKDDLPVVLDDRTQQIEHLDGNCELIINKPTPKDSGNYVCEAQNSLGSTKIAHTVVVDQIVTSRRSSGMSVTEMQEKKAKKKAADEEEVPYERRSRMPDPSPKNKLYFIANMSNRYLAEGSKVKMQAVVGGPEPQLKWTKDGANIQYGPRVKNQNREGLAVLEITSVTAEDSGQYTITARNEFNEISTTALLHVYQPKINMDTEPVFTRSLKDTYHLNSNELILETHVRGQPTPTVAWYKDSVEIQHSEKHQIIDHPDGTCELIIDKPDNKDTGKYLCKAENCAGKGEVTHYVLFEGTASHIAENIHGVFHADKSLLRKEKKEEIVTVEESAAQSATEGGDTTTDDEGGKGKKGKGKKKKEDDEVIYETAEKSDKPAKEEKREKRIGIHFRAKLSDRVVAEGSKVKLTCYVEGTEPAVKWFHNDNPIAFSPKTKMNYQEGLATLQLVDTTIETGGEYKCVAKDATGEAVSTCKLTVYDNQGNADVPPTFTRSIKDTYHGKINEIVLDVHVRGMPTPTIGWVKDGVRIEPSERYQQIEHEDGTCELFISDPTGMDSGKYVCQAENRAGKIDIVHLVTVDARNMRPPSPPPKEVVVKPQLTEEEIAAKEERKKKKQQEEEEAGGGGGRRELPPPPDLKKMVRFSNFLSNRTVPEGVNVKWTVCVEGPEPTARWFHDDKLVAFGSKSKLSFQDGIAWLNLIGVTEEESGEYKLLVRGSENEIEAKCNLTVYKTEKIIDNPPTFTVGIKDTYFLNENELVLDCRVRGTPRPEIQWMKGNDLISNGEKYQQYDQADGYCKLIVNNPTQNDSGIYHCIARNAMQLEKVTHTVDFGGRDKFIFEKTHGFFHRDPNKPHFVAPLGNQMVTVGGTIAISAEFAPTSTPIDVQWFRDKQPLAGQPNVLTFMERGVYTLAIEQATETCEGTYTCRAANAFGKVESISNINIAPKGGKIEAPPLFLSKPEQEMTIAVGDPFSFSFRLNGEPKPKLTLMKGLKDITKSDRVSKEASDDYIRFTVHKAQVPDSGTYFVVARNEFGTDRIFCTITVKPRARSVTPTPTRWGQPLDSFPETSYFRGNGFKIYSSGIT